MSASQSPPCSNCNAWDGSNQESCEIPQGCCITPLNQWIPTGTVACVKKDNCRRTNCHNGNLCKGCTEEECQLCIKTPGLLYANSSIDGAIYQTLLANPDSKRDVKTISKLYKKALCCLAIPLGTNFYFCSAVGLTAASMIPSYAASDVKGKIFILKATARMLKKQIRGVYCDENDRCYRDAVCCYREHKRRIKKLIKCLTHRKSSSDDCSSSSDSGCKKKRCKKPSRVYLSSSSSSSSTYCPWTN